MLRVSQITVLDSQDDLNESGLVKKFTHDLLDQDGQITVFAVNSDLIQCHRCRRYSSKSDNLCERCSTVIK